jgi:LAGLIDADG endonuclease
MNNHNKNLFKLNKKISRLLIKNKKNRNENKKYSTNNKELSILGPYLAGLFEGDGYVELRIKDKLSGNTVNLKKYSDLDINEVEKNCICGTLLAITFNIKDLPLCNHLKMIIGYGTIKIEKKRNTCVLRFGSGDAVLKFVQIINGYLRSPKLYKFNLSIDYLNKKYKLNIPKHEVDQSNINSNSWFSGFVDADGGFQIILSESVTRCQLRIEQRMIDPFSGLSYEPLFIKLAEFLDQKLIISTHHISKKYFLVQANNKNNLITVLSYFNKFELYSSKRLDYYNWAHAALILLTIRRRSIEVKELMLELKSSMNNKRTIFIWDHLKHLI